MKLAFSSLGMPGAASTSSSAARKKEKQKAWNCESLTARRSTRTCPPRLSKQLDGASKTPA